MEIKPSDRIEVIIDDLVMSDLGQPADSFAMSRLDAGTVLLDYGDLGKFPLSVIAET